MVDGNIAPPLPQVDQIQDPSVGLVLNFLPGVASWVPSFQTFPQTRDVKLFVWCPQCPSDRRRSGEGAARKRRHE